MSFYQPSHRLLSYTKTNNSQVNSHSYRRLVVYQIMKISQQDIYQIILNTSLLC